MPIQPADAEWDWNALLKKISRDNREALPFTFTHNREKFTVLRAATSGPTSMDVFIQGKRVPWPKNAYPPTDLERRQRIEGVKYSIVRYSEPKPDYSVYAPKSGTLAERCVCNVEGGGPFFDKAHQQLRMREHPVTPIDF